MRQDHRGGSQVVEAPPRPRRQRLSGRLPSTARRAVRFVCCKARKLAAELPGQCRSPPRSARAASVWRCPCRGCRAGRRATSHARGNRPAPARRSRIAPRAEGSARSSQPGRTTACRHRPDCQGPGNSCTASRVHVHALAGILAWRHLAAGGRDLPLHVGAGAPCLHLHAVGELPDAGAAPVRRQCPSKWRDSIFRKRASWHVRGEEAVRQSPSRSRRRGRASVHMPRQLDRSAPGLLVRGCRAAPHRPAPSHRGRLPSVRSWRPCTLASCAGSRHDQTRIGPHGRRPTCPNMRVGTAPRIAKPDGLRDCRGRPATGASGSARRAAGLTGLALVGCIVRKPVSNVMYQACRLSPRPEALAAGLADRARSGVARAVRSGQSVTRCLARACTALAEDHDKRADQNAVPATPRHATRDVPRPGAGSSRPRFMPGTIAGKPFFAPVRRTGLGVAP